MENQSGNGESSFLLPSWIHAKIISLEPSLSRKKKRRKGGEKKRKEKKKYTQWRDSFSFSSLDFVFVSVFALSLFSLESRDSFQPIPNILLYIYIYFYITFRSNFSNRIVFDRKKKKKKNLSSILPTMLTKKKKEKDKSTIAKNLLSRYFSILSNNSLSLSPSFLHAFARRIFTVRFRPFRGQQSPKYQTTLLTYRTFNNPSLGERNANNIEQIYRRLRPCREREREREAGGSAEISWNGRKWRATSCSPSLSIPRSASLRPSARPSLSLDPSRIETASPRLPSEIRDSFYATIVG